MSLSKLSQKYSGACTRMHEACDLMYESLHDNNGNPLTDVEPAIEVVTSCRKWLLLEIDLIRECVKEYKENESASNKFKT